MNHSFTYTGRSPIGDFVAGSLDARSRSEALQLLSMRSLTITSIVPSKTTGGTVIRAITGGVEGLAGRAVIFRSLATLIQAGLPLRRALEIAADQTRKGSLREAILGAAAEIESGTSFSEALSRYPRTFSRTTCAMIRAGETAGTLDAVLERVANLLERSNTTRRRTFAALAYPITVSVTAVVLVAFLVGTVVPTIRDMFRGLDRDLPLITKVLLATGDCLRDPRTWILTSIAVAGGGILLYLAMQDSRALENIERVRRALPVIGHIFRLAEVSACTRTLGTLLQTGISLDTAFSITREVVSSRAMRENLAGVTQNARMGQSLAPAFSAGGLYDTNYIALIRAGEEAGTLAEMLIRIADYADVDIESAIATLSSMLEPILIVVIGCIVGFIVAAIIVPLYSAIGSLS